MGYGTGLFPKNEDPKYQNIKISNDQEFSYKLTPNFGNETFGEGCERFNFDETQISEKIKGTALTIFHFKNRS